jgi:hypothetical protein
MGHLEHVARLHQPQLNDLALAPVRRSPEDLRHAEPPYDPATSHHCAGLLDYLM